MLFNSKEFVVFLPLVFGLYWLIGSKRTQSQNVLLLVASYVFYGWWDWRFLFLIFFSSLVDFTLGQCIARTDGPRIRKRLVSLSLLVNLGLLGTFTYFNFFIESFGELSRSMGLQVNPSTLNIILPVGISFYTFQTLSYTIDVYRNKIAPTRDPVAFFAFVSFFPQLVAGPIERATQLLPQFEQSRVFDYELAKDGLRQILWGFAKKILIADSCAEIVNVIFDSADYAAMSPVVLAAGAAFFAFQIYGDFSGYSDIAIGTSKLFGIRLMRNFAYPYFSRDIAEFWRRWHISLSTWFRDYVYIPIGGSRGSLATQVRNVFIIFLVSGFWHGANWTFIVWGGLNALYFLPLMLCKQHRRHTDSEISPGLIPPVGTVLRIAITFALTCLAWIFFRAESVTDAFAYLAGFLGGPLIPDSFLYFPPGLVLTLGLFVAFEWCKRHHEHPLTFQNTHVVIRWGLYQLLLWLILFNAVYHDASEFIYFQF